MSIKPKRTSESFVDRIGDIKLVLFFGYLIGYPLAVIAPIYIDPLLKSHVQFGSREYPYAFFCLPIYATLIATELIIMKRFTTVKSLYVSVGVFFLAIIVTFPIFLPERPHGNVLFVGVSTVFFSAFSIFAWELRKKVFEYTQLLQRPKGSVIEYLKVLTSFVRQGALGALALFGALFFAAITSVQNYNQWIVQDKSEVFLLNYNATTEIV